MSSTTHALHMVHPQRSRAWQPLLALECDDDVATAGMVPVLAQPNALPRAQAQRAVADGHGQRRAKHAACMHGGSAVGAWLSMVSIA